MPAQSFWSRTRVIKRNNLFRYTDPSNHVFLVGWMFVSIHVSAAIKPQEGRVNLPAWVKLGSGLYCQGRLGGGSCTCRVQMCRLRAWRDFMVQEGTE